MLLSNNVLSKLNHNLIYIIYKKISKKNNNNLIIEFHKYMNKNLCNYLIDTIWTQDEYYNLYSIIYNSEHILNHTFKKLNIYNISDLNQPFYNMSLIPDMWNIYIDVYDMLEYFNLPSILNCDLDGLFYIHIDRHSNILNLLEQYIEMLYDLAIYYSLDVHSFNIDILHIKNYNLNYNQDPMMFKNNYYIENYDLFYIFDYFNKLIGFDFHIEDDNFIITPINE